MDRKSTPAPWDIEPLGDGDVAVVAGPDDKEIAIFYGEDNGGKRWPVVGNAKLAALAPKMADWIETICDRLDSLILSLSLPVQDRIHVEALRKILPDIVTDARALLAKLEEP